MGRKSLRGFALTTILNAIPTLGLARDWFVLPAGAGSRTGASWETAADASRLQGIVDELKPGDRVLAGSGDYQNLALTVKSSGVAGQPITIQGQDRGSGLPVLAGRWDLEKPDKGPTALNIGAAASHVVVRDLVIRNYAHGVRSATLAPGIRRGCAGQRSRTV
jgi:hypothetical protein